MRNVISIAAIVLCLSLLPSLQAAENQFGPARLIDVESKAHERVLYYLGNTPITQDDPYYEIYLQQNNWLYQTEYTPRHAADSLSDEWKPGTEVQMKITDKRHVVVKLPGLPELQLLIVKRTPTAELTAPDAGPAKK
jgi:hypothetical protein